MIKKNDYKEEICKSFHLTFFMEKLMKLNLLIYLNISILYFVSFLTSEFLNNTINVKMYSQKISFSNKKW